MAVQLVDPALLHKIFPQAHSTLLSLLAPLRIFAALQSRAIGELADIACVHGSTEVGRIDRPHPALLFDLRPQLPALDLVFAHEAVLTLAEETGPAVPAISEHGDRDGSFLALLEVADPGDFQMELQ